MQVSETDDENVARQAVQAAVPLGANRAAELGAILAELRRRAGQPTGRRGIRPRWVVGCAWVMVLAGLVTYGVCGVPVARGAARLWRDGLNQSPTRVHTPVPIRTDLEPLRRRFPLLGKMTEAAWQVRVIGADTWVPGPSDIRIQALVVMDPTDFTAIACGYTWQAAKPGWDEHMNGQLRPFAPAGGHWRYSEQFAADLRTPLYSGAVHADLRSGTVYLNVFTS